MNMPNPVVTVVTPTRNRPKSLMRAMESVAGQRGVRVEHIVVGDRCDWLARPEIRKLLPVLFPQTQLFNLTNQDEPGLPMGYLPARLAYLRNWAVQRSTGEFVAQLDDDNTFEPDHLRSLVDALRDDPAAGAAHSWRTLWWPDGTPFLPDGEDPWQRDSVHRLRSYHRLRGYGMFEPGSNIVRDVFVAAGGMFVGRVDTNEFLVRREIFDEVTFPERFSAIQQRLRITESVTFGLALYRARVKVTPTRMATLNYRMGGYSNIMALRARPARDVPRARRT